MHTGPGKLTSTRTHLMRTTVRMQYFGCIDRAQCAWIESAKTRATATFYDRACAPCYARPVLCTCAHAYACMHGMAFDLRARKADAFFSVDQGRCARVLCTFGITYRDISTKYIHPCTCMHPAIDP